MNFQDIHELSKKTTHDSFVESDLVVESLDQLKALFTHGIKDEHREAFSKGLPAEKDFMTEIRDYVYGKGQVKSEKARKYLNIRFLGRVKAIHGKNVTIDKDIVIGPAAAPYIINADTLTIIHNSRGSFIF